MLFSKRDPQTGRFKLWDVETGRPPAPLPAAARSVPFDADLGPGAHGHFLAVYSHCEREPRWNPVDEDAPPNYSLGCPRRPRRPPAGRPVAGARRPAELPPRCRTHARGAGGAGCSVAMNLDGGGSTSLVSGGRLRNRPRCGWERPEPGDRPVSTALVFLPR